MLNRNVARSKYVGWTLNRHGECATPAYNGGLEATHLPFPLQKLVGFVSISGATFSKSGVDIISLQSYFYYWYSITHSLFHSRLKSFLFCKSSLPHPFLFLIQDPLYGFPRLFTATSEHIRLFTF